MADIFKYCSDKKKKRIIIVSDSTVAQYRNKTNVFLLQSRMCEDKDIESIKWVFTEAGHGKSSCDAVGAALKTTMRNKISFDTNLIINSVQDVIDILQPQSTMKLFAHTLEDINAIKSKINGTLSPLTKALKIHHLEISPRSVKAKYMPSDSNSFAVEIRITRQGMPNQVQEQEQELVETEEERQTQLEEAEEWAWFNEDMSLDQQLYTGNMELDQQEQPDVEQQEQQVEEQLELDQQPEVEQQVEQQQSQIVVQGTSTRATRSGGRGKKRSGARGGGRSRPGA